jgi:hypothetical protein
MEPLGQDVEQEERPIFNLFSDLNQTAAGCSYSLKWEAAQKR